MKKIVIYDFDGTLTPYPMTNFGILEKCGFIGGANNNEFQKLVVKRMVDKKIDAYTSFFETILDVIESYGYPLKDEVLLFDVDKLEYNNGVLEFLKYLNDSNVDNYIISSGIKCFLDNIVISKYFKEIYATTFKYNNKEIVGIDNLITDTKKIDCIKDIMYKNNINDCSNIIYIGDGLTDLPIMEYVKNNGGITIYVGSDIKDINKDNISYICDKDYSKNSDIYKIVSEKFNI